MMSISARPKPLEDAAVTRVPHALPKSPGPMLLIVNESISENVVHDDEEYTARANVPWQKTPTLTILLVLVDGAAQVGA